MSRSQIGLHRRGRNKSDGTPPPGGGGGGGGGLNSVPLPPSSLPNGVAAPPPPVGNAITLTSRSGSTVLFSLHETPPQAWIDATPNVGIAVSLQVWDGQALRPEAASDVFGRGFLPPVVPPSPAAIFLTPPPEVPDTWRIRAIYAFSFGVEQFVWASTPWQLAVGALADNDPDTAEELAATLAGLTTHVTLDAWVQDHEAFLPERPDTWTRMNLASKREWVMANYDFDAVEPGPLPGDTNVATDSDRDGTDSDGDDGA